MWLSFWVNTFCFQIWQGYKPFAVLLMNSFAILAQILIVCYMHAQFATVLPYNQGELFLQLLHRAAFCWVWIWTEPELKRDSKSPAIRTVPASGKCWGNFVLTCECELGRMERIGSQKVSVLRGRLKVGMTSGDGVLSIQQGGGWDWPLGMKTRKCVRGAKLGRQ